MNEACPPLQALARRAIKPAPGLRLLRTLEPVAAQPCCRKSPVDDRGNVASRFKRHWPGARKRPLDHPLAAPHTATADNGADTMPIAMFL